MFMIMDSSLPDQLVGMMFLLAGSASCSFGISLQYSLYVCGVFICLGSRSPCHLRFSSLPGFYFLNSPELTITELSVTLWYQSVPLLEGFCCHPMSYTPRRHLNEGLQRALHRTSTWYRCLLLIEHFCNNSHHAQQMCKVKQKLSQSR